jgi:hypothetical protein
MREAEKSGFHFSSTLSKFREWESVLPGTELEALFKEVCGKKNK